MVDFLTIALTEAKQGRYIFPLRGKVPITKNGVLDASNDEATIRTWAAEYPDANVGLKPTSEVFLDIDADKLEDWKARGFPPVNTRTVKTGGGGYHYYFLRPEGITIPNIPKSKGFEIKSSNQYVVAPGSIHPDTGKVYEVINDSPVAPMPDWLIELALSSNGHHHQAPSRTASIIPKGERNTTLASLAGSMRRRGMPETAIKAALLEVNTTQCQPALTDSDVERIAESIGRYQPAEPSTAIASGVARYPTTDAGNGEALAAALRGKVLFVYEWKSWLVYRGGKWQNDTAGIIRRLAVKEMRQQFKNAADIEDSKEKGKAAKWYIDSESDKRVTAMLNFTAAQPGMTITADKLDSNPWLLNLKNGTFNLQTGKLQQHNPTDLLTQQIDIEYQPGAYSLEWQAFLETIFAGNTQLIDYVQRAIGYSLNGTQLERVFFFLHGLGRNGKSQFTDALRNVLGSYANEAKPELFMEKRYSGGGPDEGQASLKGIRFLTATEVKRGQNLDVSLIKRMTGSEPIWHEKKFQRGYSFHPTHTLWLSGNHEPRIKDTTDSIWDRLNKIPFDVRIEAGQEIKGYGEKLATKYGKEILAWCIEGALNWIKRELKDCPDCVRAANEEYRAREDVLHDFLAERVTKVAGESITVANMYQEYKTYCETEQIDAIGKKTFNEAMRERGFKDKRGNYNKLEWINVTIDTNVT